MAGHGQGFASTLADASDEEIRAQAGQLDPRGGDPELEEDPYPLYAGMRRACPIARNDLHGGFWMATRYDDVAAIMRDSRTFSNSQLMVPNIPEPAGPRIPLQLDGDEHLKFRRLLLPLFSPRLANEMTPTIRETAQRLLGAVKDAEECEFIRAYAIPLPFEIMLTWLGVPRDGWDFLMEAEDAGIRLHASKPDAQQRAIALKAEVNLYFEKLIEERRRSGPTGHDLISFIVSAEVDGRPLTMNEMLRIAMLSFAAGLHSTTSTLGNMMAFLSQHLDKRDELIAHPELMPDAVEELLRYDGIATLTRKATRDVEMRGQLIKAGDAVQVLTCAANRDENQFPDADEVIFDRSPNRQIAFGVGPPSLHGFLPRPRRASRVTAGDSPGHPGLPAQARHSHRSAPRHGARRR